MTSTRRRWRRPPSPGAPPGLEGKWPRIVIKVIRPDIEPVIDADLRLMQALARLVARFVPQSARLRPVEVVEEYRKTILDELNLMREAANAIQLRRNFTGSEALYCPRCTRITAVNRCW